MIQIYYARMYAPDVDDPRTAGFNYKNGDVEARDNAGRPVTLLWLPVETLLDAVAQTREKAGAQPWSVGDSNFGLTLVTSLDVALEKEEDFEAYVRRVDVVHCFNCVFAARMGQISLKAVDYVHSTPLDDLTAAKAAAACHYIDTDASTYKLDPAELPDAISETDVTHTAGDTVLDTERRHALGIRLRSQAAFVAALSACESYEARLACAGL